MADKQVEFCGFCGQKTEEFVRTRHENIICWSCSRKYKMCEICGSLPVKVRGGAIEHLHYDEDCFK